MEIGFSFMLVLSVLVMAISLAVIAGVCVYLAVQARLEIRRGKKFMKETAKFMKEVRSTMNN